MLRPMLNTRKVRGRRGEALVARMRARQAPSDASNRVPPSTIHVGQTGTISPKRFSPQGDLARRQPNRSLPALGGLVSMRFGD